MSFLDISASLRKKKMSRYNYLNTIKDLSYMNELVSEVAIINATNVYSRIFGITMSALILITGGFLPITHS